MQKNFEKVDVCRPIAEMLDSTQRRKLVMLVLEAEKAREQAEQQGIPTFQKGMRVRITEDCRQGYFLYIHYLALNRLDGLQV